MPDPRFFEACRPAQRRRPRRADRAARCVARRRPSGLRRRAPGLGGGRRDVTFLADRKFAVGPGRDRAPAACSCPAERGRGRARRRRRDRVRRGPGRLGARARWRLHRPAPLDRAADADRRLPRTTPWCSSPAWWSGQGARIGRGTRIGANTVIGPGVQIGRDCEIGSNVTIGFALIGDRVRISAGRADRRGRASARPGRRPGRSTFPSWAG